MKSPEQLKVEIQQIEAKFKYFRGGANLPQFIKGLCMNVLVQMREDRQHELYCVQTLNQLNISAYETNK